MGGNKAVAGAVLVIIILGAVFFIVKDRTGSGGPPDRVLNQQVELITAEQPYETETFRLGDIRDAAVDDETGYRRIDGKLWASPMTCATSALKGDPHKIPAPPSPQDEAEDYDPADPETMMEDPASQPYKCPICGEEANQLALEGYPAR